MAWCCLVGQVQIAAAGIKSLVIEKCDSEDATNFQMVVGPINLGSEASAMRPELVEKEIKVTRPNPTRSFPTWQWSEGPVSP